MGTCPAAPGGWCDDLGCVVGCKAQPACRGGTCDRPAECGAAQRCLYRSSADEAREVMMAQRAALELPRYRLAPSIVGLSGKAGSGKDTIGREVLRPLGYHQFAFAWAMKANVVARGEATYEEAHHTKPPHVRHALQQEGTERGWMIHGKDYWPRMAEAWMETLREHHGISRFYITDVRFPHEMDWIRSKGGVVIRIIGRGGLDGEAAMHLSETALDGQHFDLVLDNSLDYGFPQLTAEIRSFLERRLHG